MTFLSRFKRVFLLFVFVQSQFIYADCDQYTNTGVQKIIDAARIKYHIPAIEVSIICPGEQSARNFVSGTTTLEETDLINETHLFQIGSETKSFIASIILQLEAEGLLSIDDEISNHIPNLPQTWQQITIRQLLNHSSGLYNYTDILEELMKSDPQSVIDKQWSSEELLQLIVNKASYFSAGSGFHYSNSNYLLAGMLIEIITHRPLTMEMKIRVFDPLNLHHTHYLPVKYDQQIMLQMAHGYSERGAFSAEPKDITATNHSWANAAGALISTSNDVAIWFKHLTHGDILAPLQMQELTTVIEGTLPNASKPIEYGLGVIHDKEMFGEEAWWHSGGTFGYSALMVWLQSSDIIITANISHATTKRDIYYLTKDLAYFLRKPGKNKQIGILTNQS